MIFPCRMREARRGNLISQPRLGWQPFHPSFEHGG
jgi:hypothetical protein